jgi:hypothetical protein
MWLSNSKKYAMDRFWKIVHHVGSLHHVWRNGIGPCTPPKIIESVPTQRCCGVSSARRRRHGVAGFVLLLTPKLQIYNPTIKSPPSGHQSSLKSSNPQRFQG